MRILSGLVVLALLCTAGFAQAADKTRTLQAFYQNVHTLSADFHQEERDDRGNLIQQANGTFLLSRPGKFRWEYKKPYKQIIVSDGKKLKFYDVGLAQVTIRKVGNTLRATPALLLTGGEALSKAFNITDKGRHDGLAWVRLKPRSNSNFKSIELGLQGDVPKVMKLHDNLGQTTRIKFSNVKVNPALSSSRFNLKIPENVEVVDARPKDQ